MTSIRRLALIVFAAVTPLAAVPASAQQSPAVHQQVVSANPFGVLFSLFNAEIERRVSPSATGGVGGSMFVSESDDYGTRLVPLLKECGVKAGATTVDSDTFFGYGVDVNWSRLMGRDDKFYMGWGFGVKRLVGAVEYTRFIPTIRIVNIGVAF